VQAADLTRPNAALLARLAVTAGFVTASIAVINGQYGLMLPIQVAPLLKINLFGSLVVSCFHSPFTLRSIFVGLQRSTRGMNDQDAFVAGRGKHFVHDRGHFRHPLCSAFTPM